MNDLANKFTLQNRNVYKIIIFLLVLMAIFIRCYQYLYNRSLWMDEIYLCSSLLDYSYTELSNRALDYGQKAPLAFLLLVKVCLDIFGKNEFSLRFIPLLSGVISFLLFIRVASSFLRPWGKLIAIAIFALSPAMIYHSTEIKQYSTECLAAVFVLFLYTRYKDKIGWQPNLIWGLYGAISVWFSFSVIFILAGIAFGTLLDISLRKQWKILKYNLLPGMMWLTSFIINYFFFIQKHPDSGWTTYFFKVYNNFMPFPPQSLNDLKWFGRNYRDMFDYPLGLTWSLPYTNSSLMTILTLTLPSFLFILGFISLYNTHKKEFFIFASTITITLLASGLHFYPLIERFWLFLAPIFILIIATGFDYLKIRLKSFAICITFAIALLIPPMIQSLYYIVHPKDFYKHKKSYQREALTYISQHIEDGDIVYNYWNNNPGYQVYKKIYNFNYNAVDGHDFRKSSTDLDDYNSKLAIEFKKLRGKKRVWLIYNRQFLTDIGDLVDQPLWYYKNSISPIINIKKQIEKIGKPVDKRLYTDVEVYLYKIKD